MHLDLVSQDRLVYSAEVNEVLAPGAVGQMGVLPKHAPLITVLSPGEVMVRQEGQADMYFAVSGGWMEVLPNKVTILARTAEHSDEINLQRAEEARARAERLLAEGVPPAERTGLELALRRSQVRLKVARRRHARPGEGDLK
jgi:F-type H+-transporting ATPase subunit epsilon